MSTDDHDYFVERIPAIRKLIQEAFNPQTLRWFCQDLREFHPLLSQFDAKPNLDDMADAVIEHCRTQVLFAELLEGIRGHSPRHYARHYAAIYGERKIEVIARPEAEPVSASISALPGFVDRTRELALFRRMLAGEVPQRILCILESAERGKTYLLLRLLHECEQQAPPLPVVLLNFDRRSSGLADYLGVAREVRRSLGDGAVPAVCACEEGIAAGRLGPAGPAWEEALGRALARDLAALGRAAVLVDTFEHASEEARRWLERWLLEPMRRELPGVLAVVAGRPECQGFFDPPRLWSGLVTTIDRFDPLDDGDILEHYRQRGLTISPAEVGLLQIARLEPGAEWPRSGDLLEQARRGGGR